LFDASLLLSGFNVPIDSGGFTYKEKYGWWYEELADRSKHTPRILDGHLFALLGLYDYYQISGDSMALHYFNQGAASLKHLCQPMMPETEKYAMMYIAILQIRNTRRSLRGRWNDCGRSHPTLLTGIIS
jgi:hypothetical protein